MMNRQFYEFWGNVFINAARSQKQLEEINTWMQQGVAGFNELTALFQRFYSPQAGETKAAPDAPNFQQALADLKDAFDQFAGLWGWVPQKEHQAVLERCAALEEQVQAQQTTISQLQELLAQEGLGHTELFLHFQKSLKEQSEQFHKLMESIHGAGNDNT